MKTKNEANYSTWDLLMCIWDYIRPYRGRFIFGSIIRLIGDIAYLYPAIAIASIISFFENYHAGESLGPFWHIMVLWFGAVAVRILGNYGAKYFIFLISEKTAIDAQLKVLKHLFRLDIAWHEKENAGNKLKKIQRGSNGLDRIIRMWVNNYIEIAVNFVGISIVLARKDWKVAAIMVVFVATYYLLSSAFLRRAKALVQEANEREEDISGLVYQAINNIRSVKIANISGRIYGMVFGASNELFLWIRRRVISFQARGAVLSAWSIIFRLGVMAAIAVSISKGQSDLGFMILFNMYFMRITESTNELSNATQDLIINKLGIARMQAILAETETDNDLASKRFPKSWSRLSVENLSFSYGDREVLGGISFEIKRGERVGIVGLSGAGKSTLFKLLLKENENYRGEIRIDNVPLRDIRKADYYRHVGVVLQETEVFNFSLRENIGIAADEMKKTQLQQALAISHVDDFLPRLPEGLDTFIGEKGVRLSGGEKQRLGIARAICKQPQILFMDEATSHLDLESEEKIRESLQTFFKQVTAVVIAHRLTTIREMDKIILIEEGAIKEMGSFEELIGKKGRFYELWSKQEF